MRPSIKAAVDLQALILTPGWERHMRVCCLLLGGEYLLKPHFISLPFYVIL